MAELVERPPSMQEALGFGHQQCTDQVWCRILVPALGRCKQKLWVVQLHSKSGQLETLSERKILIIVLGDM